MLHKIRWLTVIMVCLLCLLMAGTVSAEWGPDEGTIRGAAFLDSNKNGVMDEGEKGIGWVYFTISRDDYSHTYYSEWRETGEAGETYATGTYGPAPLPKGWWKITYHVPEGYVATTPTEISVNVPGKDGGHVAEAYLGLYPSGSNQTVSGVLPQAGAIIDPVAYGALSFLSIGSLGALGLGLKARRKE